MTQWLTNTRDAQGSSGYSDRCICCDDCPSTCVIRDAQQWRHRQSILFHSLMLSFHNLRGLPLRSLRPAVPCSRPMIFGSVSWRQSWPNHDSLRRLTVDIKSSWRPVKIYRLVGLLSHIFVCFVFSVWYAKHSSVAFVLFSNAWNHSWATE